MSRRWIQNPLPPHNLIPREEYVRPKEASHFVMGDLQTFVSPLDGTVISDRRKYRDHMAKHGVVPAQDYSQDYLAKRRAAYEGEINSKAASKERKTAIYNSWVQAERN